jgi:2-C-methyl-D-erythritol 4-phosphate cytidylyltransferase
LDERDIKMKEFSRERVGAVVVAAGGSQRMGGVDKIFAIVAGKPVLAHVLSVFERCSLVNQVVVVLNAAGLEQGREMVESDGFSKVVALCRGGERRQDSVAEGLKRLEGCYWVIVHDGARPCVTSELVERGLDEVRQTGAAIAAVPVKETVKVIDVERIVQNTPHRGNLWVAQTPQIFRFDIIVKAYRQTSEEVTDDAAAVEALGHKVKVYMGLYENIKVTTQEDLALAEIIMRGRDEGRHWL